MLAWQAADAQALISLTTCRRTRPAGFPVPFYPLSLQQADAHARVADLDVEIIADSLVSAVAISSGATRRTSWTRCG